MARLPTEPEAFAVSVASILNATKPHLSIDLAEPGELVVDGRRLGLENLRRMVAQEEDRGTEIATEFLRSRLADDTVSLPDIRFDFARERILPRIVHRGFLDEHDLALVTHIPFLNDTIVIFTIIMRERAVLVTADSMARWRVHPKELYALSVDNLARYNPDQTPGKQIELIEEKSEKYGTVITAADGDGFDSSRILLPAVLENLLQKSDSGEVSIFIPALDAFFAIEPTDPLHVKNMHELVRSKYETMPYPISPDPFEVTNDGIQGFNRVRFVDTSIGKMPDLVKGR